MTVRCLHDRGDIGPSNSSIPLLVPLVEGGISMAFGLRDLEVDAFEAAILPVDVKEIEQPPSSRDRVGSTQKVQLDV